MILVHHIIAVIKIQIRKYMNTDID